MPHSFLAKLAEAWPPADWADVTVIAAVSGGADSVALLHALVSLKAGGAGRLCVVHLNHRLRPDADRDEHFVRELCQQLDVPCEIGRIDVGRLAIEEGDGIEAAARTARYDFFREAAERLGARFVATAHTADDQAETILHRIIRGTGVRGLSGMARVRPLGHATLIRPMLGVRRREVQAYLESLGQSCRHDASNDDLRFTRNRIRHETMPLLRAQYNLGVDDSLLRLGALAGEAQALIDGLVEELHRQCVVVEGPAAVLIELAPLIGRSDYLLRELLMAVWRRQRWPLQSMGRRQWEELGRMATGSAPPSRRTLPGNVAAEVFGGQMRLSRTDLPC